MNEFFSQALIEMYWYELCDTIEIFVDENGRLGHDDVTVDVDDVVDMDVQPVLPDFHSTRHSQDLSAAFSYTD